MKRKTLFTLATASILMLSLPLRAWADGSNEVTEDSCLQTQSYPLATEAIPASEMTYDSVAQRFVVQEPTMKTSSPPRSNAAMGVQTRASWGYWEDGVQYSYYGDQLSSDDMDAMKEIVNPWKEKFTDLDVEGILTQAPGEETWYMQITGVDNDDIDDLDGTMRIYNDIGSTYNYKTIAIDGSALRGNTHIQRIVFEDCASGSANANTMLKMVIHDGAFQNCSNLRELYMYYTVTDGTNHEQMLKPTDVYIGSNVFDGCHEDFRIVVDPLVYKMFLADPNWNKYADYIVASNYTPTDFEEEDGVKYGYFGHQLSSSKIDEMKTLLEPWTTEFRNLDLDQLLVGAPNKETWYMQIVGVDNNKIAAANGEMRIYNDIGTTYNYKTIAINSTALQGNENIQKVVFEDCASGLDNANTRLKMVIHDGAFQNCSNLKEFNMYYLATDGDNRYEMLYPTDVLVGSDVFDGCHQDFRIVVAPQLYDMYISDPNWSQYADKIVASDYMPTIYDPITHEGVTYDYASKSLNSLPTSELTRLQSSWWNAAIIGVEVAIAIATWGSANAATTSAKAAAQLTAEAARQTAINTAQTTLNAAVQTALSETAKLTTIINATWQPGMTLSSISSTALTTALNNVSIASTALAAKEVAVAAAVTNYSYYMMAAGISAASAAGVGGLTYVANTVGKKTHRNPTWALQGQWLMTECKHTIYHMYVKEVADQETVTLYNDIGSAYNYKTVSIGNTAFHNKTNLKTINFKDVNTGEMYAPMTILIPDKAFKGCSNLETLNLIMHSNATNRDVALGPENFIVCGEDIFEDCDMSKLKIRIGREKYEDFAENPVWGKYVDNFEVVDIEEPVDFTDFGAQYSYSFENNSQKKQSYIGGHTIEHLHIIGQNGDMASQNGEVGLVNDIGINHNYKLDYVAKKAFYGSETLKGISMFDLKGFGATGDAYTDLEVVLQDSAFANCPNLEHINMLYFRTDGGNSVEPMAPYRVMLGKDVFKDCPKFKVKMVTTAVEEFEADTAWVKYKDRFLPSFIMTEDPALMSVLRDCGMRYSSPVMGGSYDIYDVMQVTDPATLNGKFQGKALDAFHEFKAFECINLDYVGDSWFKDCTKLQGIELPTTLQTIGKQAFYNCALLDDVVIPESVNTISDEAFKSCASLSRVTFQSATPASLGTDVFAALPNNYIIYVPAESVEAYKTAWPDYADHIQSVSEKHTGIFEVTLTEPGTLAEKLGLTITGTDPLTISGNYHKYDKLKISGPINGTDIGVIRHMGGRDVNNAEVTRARNLKYLDLYDADIKAGGEDYNQDGSNDRITEDNCIDTYMFWQLDVLETLILPKSATKIKEYAFNHCNALSRLVIGDNIKSIGKKVTHDSPKLQEVILLCNEVPTTDANAWSKDKTIKVFYTTNAIREHLSGSHAYYTRGDSIVSPFEDDALIHALAEKRIFTLMEMASMKNVENIVNGNTEITKFNELMVASNVTELGEHSLNGCSNLMEVALPYSVDTITVNAFTGCTSLTTINAICDTIPGLATDAFKDLPENFVIYVTPGKEEDYRKAWPQYANHIQGIKESKDEIKVVTVPEPGKLGEALGFTVEMDTPSDVGRISGDFISIKALKVKGYINGKDIAVLRMLGGRDEEDADEVALARMTYLDLYDATICTDLNDICFNRKGKNDYVKQNNEIPEHMFWKLDKLQTIILPKNVTKIDDNAFYDCLNIETIVVGDATTVIGNDAFGACKNLKNLVFLCRQKPTLDSDAFTDPISDQPYQVEKMYVPTGLYQNYVTDTEYTSHAKEVCTNFTDDEVFRAYGSRAVMSTDQLQGVTDVDGWFDYHTGVKDLTSLEKTSVDTLKSTTLASLTNLQKIKLPATLKQVEAGAFAANDQLQWADFAACTEAGVLTESNIGTMGFADHTLIYAPENFAGTGYTNVVYGNEGDLKCDRMLLSENAGFDAPRAFKASSISFDRVFAGNERTTLCLPFDMEVPYGMIVYEMTSSTHETITVSPVTKVMRAYTPYIILPDEDMTIGTEVETTVSVAPNNMPETVVGNYHMIGTLSATSAEDIERYDLYLLGANNYWNIHSGQALLPYRAYMQSDRDIRPEQVLMIEDMIEYELIADGTLTEYEVAKDKIVRDLNYTRTLNDAWNALYVPFKVELTEDLLDNYDVAYINDIRSYDLDDDGELDGWDVEIIKIKKVNTKLKAHHPYVIRPKNEMAKQLDIAQHNTMLYNTAPEYRTEVTCSSAYMEYIVKGLYNKTVSAELNDSNYVYAVNKKGQWQKMGLEASLVPFRLYLSMSNKDGSPVEISGQNAQTMRMILVGEESEDGTTFIDQVETDNEQEDARIYDLQGRRVLTPQKGHIYIINKKKVLF
jgi:hypothetical protein